MKLNFVVAIGLVSLVACSAKHQDKTGIQGKGGGQGTVNVSGDLNKSSTIGGSDTTSRVSCIRALNVNYSSITLSAENSKEELKASFDSANFPMGNFNFTGANAITYSTKDSWYSSQGRDCSGTFSTSGNKLSGNINCRGMVSQSGIKLVNVSTNFECDIVTFSK